MNTIIGVISNIVDVSVKGKDKKLIVDLSINREVLFITFKHNLQMFTNYKQGDRVKISFTYNGSIYKGKYINNINGHSISLEQ